MNKGSEKRGLSSEKREFVAEKGGKKENGFEKRGRIGTRNFDSPIGVEDWGGKICLPQRPEDASQAASLPLPNRIRQPNQRVEGCNTIPAFSPEERKRMSFRGGGVSPWGPGIQPVRVMPWEGDDPGAACIVPASVSHWLFPPCLDSVSSRQRRCVPE